MISKLVTKIKDMSRVSIIDGKIINRYPFLMSKYRIAKEIAINFQYFHIYLIPITHIL